VAEAGLATVDVRIRQIERLWEARVTLGSAHQTLARAQPGDDVTLRTDRTRQVAIARSETAFNGPVFLFS
jgi:hypothetical protein